MADSEREADQVLGSLDIYIDVFQPVENVHTLLDKRCCAMSLESGRSARPGFGKVVQQLNHARAAALGAGHLVPAARPSACKLRSRPDLCMRGLRK